MNNRSARRSAAVLAILAAGMLGCESAPTTPTRMATSSASPSLDLISQTYTSGSQVMTWDAIPEPNQPPNFAAAYCTNTPHVGRDANWQNPHNAFVIGGHPWANDFFAAPWINAWSNLSSSGSGNHVSPYYNWTRYQTQVSGNGTFVIKLLADNCSWVYLDGTLVGVQADDHSHVSQGFGLTLNGTHTLEFIIFDGGGAAGGKFSLSTTSNPPPPLNDDLDNDGHANAQDAFPLDPTEWVDTDHDGVGDNKDKFPTDPAESVDTDGDGVGDNSDAYPNDPTRTVADNTPPVITSSVVGTVGANGWYTSSVGLSWTVVDNESPATKSGCDAMTLTSNQSETSYTCSATSQGGMASGSASVRIDQSRPTVTGAVTSGTLGNNGWYVSDVGITWTVSAAGPSGQVMSPACSNTALSADSPNSTFTCSATSGAGLSSAPASLSVKRDATKPVVTYAVSNGGSYTVDQVVSVTCSASDNLSGVQSSTCANVSGDAYTFALGTTTYSATAVDKAGNSSLTATTSINVTATTGSVCALVERWVSNKGVANSLCVKLSKSNYEPFRNEVQAQSGKWIAADRAAILLGLVKGL
ncbi:MAG: hypothetical protein JWO05_2819 [Gemmatimonadetes bacterium]|nr:hypothetical protein [Gemmatimonadota bacterium]